MHRASMSINKFYELVWKSFSNSVILNGKEFSELTERCLEAMFKLGLELIQVKLPTQLSSQHPLGWVIELKGDKGEVLLTCVPGMKLNTVVITNLRGQLPISTSLTMKDFLSFLCFESQESLFGLANRITANEL